MNKLDRNELEKLTALYDSGVERFAVSLKELVEIVFVRAETAAQEKRFARLDVIGQVVDDVFVLQNGAIPTVIEATATTVPMRYSPEHHRTFSREALSTFFRKAQKQRCITQLEAAARGAK